MINCNCHISIDLSRTHLSFSLKVENRVDNIHSSCYSCNYLLFHLLTIHQPFEVRIKAIQDRLNLISCLNKRLPAEENIKDFRSGKKTFLQAVLPRDCQHQQQLQLEEVRQLLHQAGLVRLPPANNGCSPFSPKAFVW